MTENSKQQIIIEKISFHLTINLELDKHVGVNIYLGNFDLFSFFLTVLW